MIASLMIATPTITPLTLMINSPSIVPPMIVSPTIDLQSIASPTILSLSPQWLPSSPHCDGLCDKCLCCTIHIETATHVLLCPEAGRVEAFQLGTTALERWLEKAGTDPDLTDSIVKYVRRWGTITMEEAIIDDPPRFRHMALSQDKIGGWRRFQDGMITTEITSIQRQYIAINGSRMSLDKWCTGLITRLLEITHGQWLYRN